jgi:hypothetical protein
MLLGLAATTMHPSTADFQLTDRGCRRTEARFPHTFLLLQPATTTTKTPPPHIPSLGLRAVRWAQSGGFRLTANGGAEHGLAEEGKKKKAALLLRSVGGNVCGFGRGDREQQQGTEGKKEGRKEGRKEGKGK